MAKPNIFLSYNQETKALKYIISDFESKKDQIHINICTKEKVFYSQKSYNSATFFGSIIGYILVLVSFFKNLFNSKKSDEANYSLDPTLADISDINDLHFSFGGKVYRNIQHDFNLYYQCYYSESIVSAVKEIYTNYYNNIIKRLSRALKALLKVFNSSYTDVREKIRGMMRFLFKNMDDTHDFAIIKLNLSVLMKT
jgi:hypothetical protein